MFVISKSLRVISYDLRFMNKCHRKEKFYNNELVLTEIQDAPTEWILDTHRDYDDDVFTSLQKKLTISNLVKQLKYTSIVNELFVEEEVELRIF